MSKKKKNKDLTPYKKSSFKKNWLLPSATLGFFVLVVVSSIFIYSKKTNQTVQVTNQEPVLVEQSHTKELPSPVYKSQFSVEQALKNVRPRRSYSDDAVSLENVSQLLWAAQGVNVEWGDRTAPSSKSTYPLSLYLIANNITNLENGLYLYIPGDRQIVHTLDPITSGNYQTALFNNLNQNSMKNPAGVFVITGNMNKMAEAYGGVAHDREVYMEAGHAAQNIYLQAESLKLGSVALGSFDEGIIRNIINTPEEETIIYLIPFGQIKN